MSMQVLVPGPCTTVQDLGRKGWQASGFAPSGAMDPVAAQQANALLGNDPGEAVLEFCLLGPTLRFAQPTWVAVTGGDFGLTVGGRPAPAYAAVRVEAGQTLALRPGRFGVYGCLAVLGGLALPLVMGSRSTNLKCGLGGLEGRRLQKGDVLALRHPAYALQRGLAGRQLPPPAPPQPVMVLRAVPGPQEQAFTPAGRQTFYGSEYTLTAQCDRMGFRLEGPAVETVAGSDILSDGIPLGGIQIPGSGQPIVMMADRQTTGGYAKIATVATADLPKLAQLRQGSRVRFAAVTVQQAQALLRAQARALAEQRQRLIGPLFA